MQLKNVLLTATLALSASAAGNNTTDIAPVIQNRLAALELGYLHTNIQLEQLRDGAEGVDADDVIATYLNTVKNEDSALDKPQPSKALQESTQLTLCQAFHSLTVTGLTLDNALYNNVNQFNSTQRGQILRGLGKVSDETSRFYSNVASKALPYCVKTVQTDDMALTESFKMVKGAYASN
ncbi:uncharacterized protein DSM5745_00716 [Aspergillus mulundensis]|uniref:Uncharacterized protein n=1 Tax=Aspergillus mulundensis TaxID=1810919 RepID=A0A3D8T4C2_9EURO|nr:hypothetical protein DSM5745_00716 [Aspergillus mulundensis]RDW93394.1 hypothetical protein DSM5745_00716 [Aspergillus mulundensis]